MKKYSKGFQKFHESSIPGILTKSSADKQRRILMNDIQEEWSVKLTLPPICIGLHMTTNFTVLG